MSEPTPKVLTITQKIEYDHMLSYKGRCPIGMNSTLSGRIQDLMGILVLEPNKLAIPVYISEEWHTGHDRITNVYVRVFERISEEDVPRSGND